MLMFMPTFRMASYLYTITPGIGKVRWILLIPQEQRKKSGMAVFRIWKYRAESWLMNNRNLHPVRGLGLIFLKVEP